MNRAKVKAPRVENSTRKRNGIVQCYCVECPGWRSVAILTRATAFVRHNGVRVDSLDTDDALFVCSVCRAEVDYLLSDELREMVISQSLTCARAPRIRQKAGTVV